MIENVKLKTTFRRPLLRSGALRPAALLAVSAFLGLASGCMQFQEEWIILPDGSGKMVIRVAVDLETLRKSEKFGVNPKDLEKQLSFSDLAFDKAELGNGFVAMAKPRIEKKDGWRIMTITAYYEDINKVTFGRAGDSSKIKFSFKKEGEGYLLEVDENLFSDAKLDGLDKVEDVPEEQAEAAWEMVKDFTVGFELARSVKMPGAVTSVDGYASKTGRIAINKLTESDLQGLKDIAKAGKIAKPGKRKVVCGKSEVSEADLAAFKEELEDAKAAWPKIQAELKAEAEKKKKDSEKDQKKDE